ncbi:DNA adenine methylase [Filifactor villosus]|uniref:DNA adenine methylase n=1 Tax=Filifactor villosus TaxID=29374 RepID=A0ABV9QP34_9FIRM
MIIKPPISRLGGKSRLKGTIISMLPEHDCYVEVFAGAAWVYFSKNPSAVEVVNDKDDHVRLAETLHRAKGKFLLAINDHPLSRQLYHNYRIKEVETMYSASKTSNKKVKELIITNY